MRHVIWSCSVFLPSIIKIFQRVFDLQSRHEIYGLSLSNITKGDNLKSKKGRVVILLPNMSSGLFYISAKYHQNIPKGIRVTERTRNLFQIKQRVITPKVKPELSILYATHHLVLIYISTKYHQNIPKGIQVTERTRSFTLTLMPTGSVPKTICPHPSPLVGGGHNNSKSRQTRVMIHVFCMSSHGALHLCEVSCKYHEQYQSYEYMVEIAMFNIQRAITPKVGQSELRFMCSAHRLMVHYSCVKFHENISKGIIVMEWTRNYEALIDGQTLKISDSIT